MTHAAWRRLPPGLLLLLLAACAGSGPAPGSREAREQQELVTACRQRADAAYNLTHRDQIYAGPSQVNTPFSANYQPGVQDRGLSLLFERDQRVSDCVRNTGVEGTRSPGAELPSGPQR